MITTVITTFSGVFLVVLGWILGGKTKANTEIKKLNSEIKQQEVNATISIQSMFDTFTIQYQKQYDAVIKQVDELKKEIFQIKKEKEDYKKLAEYWEQKFNELQKEHDDIKKVFHTLKKSMK